MIYFDLSLLNPLIRRTRISYRLAFKKRGRRGDLVFEAAICDIPCLGHQRQGVCELCALSALRDPMHILMIDNYDSFTFNLVHILEGFDEVSVTVRKNDQVSLDEVEDFSRIILSPGPGLPSDAGIMPSLVKRYAPSKSILGVCLGHQCIGEVFGASLRNIAEPLHGKSTPITVTDPREPLFQGLTSTLNVGRYHSWVIDHAAFPHNKLRITAVDQAGEVMAIRHKDHDLCGVQFHPESVLTEHGRTILENWLFQGSART